MTIKPTEVKLLDCPFCGQDDNNDSIRLEDDSLLGLHGRLVNGYFWIQCHSCGARGPETKSQEEAINAWQRLPFHYAGEELAPCPQCAGTGRWYKTEEQKQAENFKPPYFCDIHGMEGHTANSPMCDRIREDIEKGDK